MSASPLPVPATPEEAAELAALLVLPDGQPDMPTRAQWMRDCRAEWAAHWHTWMGAYFPDIHATGYAERHVSLWEWADALRPGVKPLARIECWARGSGKSATAELICTRIAANPAAYGRRFALYVCRTQAQADAHVQSVAALMTQAGLAPALSQVNRGRPQSWRRDQIRTATGFAVAGYGLDVASRGIKIDQYRPDLIILDDIDQEDDSPDVTAGNETSIRMDVLPTGTSDAAVLYVQNLICGNGVMARLVTGRAEWLLDRHDATVSPAVEGLEVEPCTLPSGRQGYRITAGTATWPGGQGLATCEAQINEWGLEPFLREAQHEVSDLPSDPVYDVAYLSAILPTMPIPLRVYEPGELGICGWLEVWERPQPNVKYIIGADVSEGIKRTGSDESTADVLRVDTGAQVASYWGKPDNRRFAEDLANLAYTYNEAEVAPENNDMGHAVIAYLSEWGGTRIWSGRKGAAGGMVPDQDSGEGWRAGAGSKAARDSALRTAIVDCAHGKPVTVFRSKRVVEQLMHYIHLPGGGRGNAPGYHDDHNTSYGIAYYLVHLHREAAASMAEYGEPEPWQGRNVGEYGVRRAGR